ncbi:MAG: hypothetical protein HZB91_04485 [Elusimicrobia bacterium]|nr:hypothetical protein [Elusimicrobiota bacterium]
MEPLIPDGSYCVFRSERGGSRDGKVVLVEYAGLQDPDTGMCYTVKKYRSEKEYLDPTFRNSRTGFFRISEPLVLLIASA